MKKDQKHKDGITLISLVVTIIVLIILAGVSIHFILGQNGILHFAKQATTKTEEMQAREQLELVLLDLQSEKETSTQYDESTDINNRLQKENMTVLGDIVIVNGWQFMIDRSIPEIKINLGKGKQNDNILITPTVAYSEDYTNATVTIDIICEKELVQIAFNGIEQEILEAEKTPENYHYTLSIPQLTSNGIYSIFIKDETESYQIKSIEITEILVDIYTVEDLLTFQRRVDEGISYDGKTIRLMNHLDLSSICNETKGSFKPIGASQKTFFKGTFDGNYHTIRNLYIDTNLYRNVGLFSVNNGTIKNLILRDCTINSRWIHSSDSGYVGGISGGNIGSIVCCSILGNSTISFNFHDNETVSTWLLSIGGISGSCANNGIIEKCSNEAQIKIHVAKANTTPSKQFRVGGITATTNNGTVIDCYHTGAINVYGPETYSSLGIAGIVAENEANPVRIRNTYNIGKIILSGINGTSNVGAIAGYAHSSYSDTSIQGSNNYYSNALNLNDTLANAKSLTPEQMKTVTFINLLNTKQSYNSNLDWSSSYIEDENNAWTIDASQNNGYPILKWQLEHSIWN